MSVADAGFLVALLDPRDSDHEVSARTMRRVRRPPTTTWPAITEAMYLLGRRGWAAQERLWQMIRRDALIPRALTEQMRERSYELMRTYHDLPMDLADATLVALAEAERDWQILTLDGHFRLYRPRGRRTFDLLPDD